MMSDSMMDSTPERSAPSRVRIGTRTSQLALWQTAHVARLVEQRYPVIQCDFVQIVTQGDRRLDRPLPEIGGKGLFTAELEEALRSGAIDLAVHSLKDLPVDNAPGLAVGAVVSRADVHDVLVARENWTLATLPPGAVVGTSSPRRQAQLLAYRPDLVVRPIRGNVESRIRKVTEGAYDAAILAGAGLERLGLEGQIRERLSLEVMLPAPGQGALGIQCRADDNWLRSVLDDLNEPQVERATQAERRLLWLLGGGCSAPVAALAKAVGQGGELHLRARVATPDGLSVLEASATGSNPLEVAAQVAADLRQRGVESLLATRPPLPLAGKRIVVTRPEQQARDLAGLLQAQGAHVILAPAAQVEPLADLASLDHALQELDAYHWILFTSANAAAIVCERPGAQSLLDQRPSGLRIAAVGPATVDALRARGVGVDFIPGRFHGEALAEELPIRQGERVLLARSAIGGAGLVERLAARGAVVKEVPVYTTQPAVLTDDGVTALRRPWEIVIFTSGSTVRGFVAAAARDPAIAAHLDQAEIACIGPATAAVVTELGYTAHVVAEDHTAAGIVAALVQAARRSV